GTQRADERSDIRAKEGEHAGARDEIQAGIHAKHQQLALGEVDNAHDAEDQPEPDAHQPVDTADRHAGGDGVQRVLDEDFEVERLSCASLARLSYWLMASVSSDQPAIRLPR